MGSGAPGPTFGHQHESDVLMRAVRNRHRAADAASRWFNLETSPGEWRVGSDGLVRCTLVYDPDTGDVDIETPTP